MKTIKLGSSGSSVKALRELLGMPADSDTFDLPLDKAVKDYQTSSGLLPDGVVGPKSWLSLFIKARGNMEGPVTEADYVWAGKYLDVPWKALKALTKVETGGRSGFLPSGKPQILFEGHYMYRYLGNSAREISKKFPSLVYPKWTRQYYKGGEAEWARFEEARKISVDGAIYSTSFGMFQVMGANYAKTGCASLSEFYTKMCASEISQFVLGLEFLRSTKINEPLANLDWPSTARLYNGPAQVPVYSKRLAAEYKKLV